VKINKLGVLAALPLAIVGVGATTVSSQKVEAGFLNRSVVVDGDEYRYQVYVPREFALVRYFDNSL
jgi:hypothetical protein